MEKDIVIRTKDKYKLFGTVQDPTGNSKGLVILVHGFTGHKDEHIFYNSSKFFVDKGYSVFRFNLYAHNKGARNFENTSISIHGEDISKVVNFFTKDYKEIFVIGHSFGGTSLLFTEEKNISGFIFWDASYIEVEKERKDFTYIKELDIYSLDFGMRILVGKRYVEELLSFPDCGELVAKITKPIYFIGASKGGNKMVNKYFKKSKSKTKKTDIINGADHCFNKHEHEADLIKKTFEWIKSLK